MRKQILLVSAALVFNACSSETATSDIDHAATESPAATVVSETRTADYNETKNAYFGDLHVHTKNSFDAFIFNIRATPDDAYRWAAGGSVKHPLGYDIKMGGPPLDFFGVTDHAAYMGILPAMYDKNNPLSEHPLAAGMFGTDPETITNAFQTVGASVRSGEPLEGVYDQELIKSVWGSAQAAADRHYKPGTLTTFSGYEYTAVTTDDASEGFGGGNLHRNVIFKDKAPADLFGTLHSVNPEDLWDWMDGKRADGMDVISIPHNSNVSNGEMFKLRTYDGSSALDADYAAQRMRNEPVIEITQVKGTSDTHPMLSPNDEWADHEIYELLLGSDTVSKISGGFVREALANGIGLQNSDGFNPFKFGIMASSDSHLAAASFDEKKHVSKVGVIDGTPEMRGSVPSGGAKTWQGVERDENAENWFSKWSASGLAGVWAEENTREAIFSALRRKESFGTTGPRIRPRLFAGYGYGADLLTDSDLTAKAYEGGVPMGSNLKGSGEVPTFLAWAMRDPRSAPLQRLQIIKVWHEGGQAQETVYDAACSDGSEPDANTHRCADNGASVDLTDCSLSINSGAPELRAMWQDPDFNPDQRTAYYVRVLENPTCRWSTWEAMQAGVERHPDLPATIQERAWTSPIWYEPQK